MSETYDVELDELSADQQEALADLRDALDAARDQIDEARVEAIGLMDVVITGTGVQTLIDSEEEIEGLLEALPEEEATDVAVG